MGELADESDIPHWFWRKEEKRGMPYKRGDRWTNWFWERCLSEGTEFTMADMHRAEFWLDRIDKSNDGRMHDGLDEELDAMGYSGDQSRGQEMTAVLSSAWRK